MKESHGGDIYRNHVHMDFSVNVNPLGVPAEVKDALYKAVAGCDRYPDIQKEELKKAVSAALGIPEDYLLFGNGASELFMACVHGIRPKKTIIPVPSFYGYEYAAEAVDGEVIYYRTRRGTEFCMEEDFLALLTEKVDLVFLANPNNPTGNLMDKEYLRAVFAQCRKYDIKIILDECFIEFCGRNQSMLHEIGAFGNVILIRAFTKTFAIPGVRLGYLACADSTLLQKIGRQLPEWNVSIFAQASGVVCARQGAFLDKTAKYVAEERRFLQEGLSQPGITVLSGGANFIFLYSGIPLYEKLLERGILIRDCGNFRGLAKGYYRIAVKGRQENEALLKAIGEICR